MHYGGHDFQVYSNEVNVPTFVLGRGEVWTDKTTWSRKMSWSVGELWASLQKYFFRWTHWLHEVVPNMYFLGEYSPNIVVKEINMMWNSILQLSWSELNLEIPLVPMLETPCTNKQKRSSNCHAPEFVTVLKVASYWEPLQYPEGHSGKPSVVVLCIGTDTMER